MIKDPLYLINPSMKPYSEPLYIGPYTVVRRTKYGPYILRDDTVQVLNRRVPIDQMKVLFTPSQLPTAEQEKLEADDVWQVDRILDHKDEGGGMSYHVLWKGHSRRQATWEQYE